MKISSFKNTRIIHKWLGIVSAVFIVILSVSGFLLMHPEEFGIEQAQISGKYLPEKYFQVEHARRHIQSIAVASGSTLYAGTDIGVYRSQDNGKTWLQINQGLFDQDIRILQIQQNDPNTIYAGSAHGIFKSEDSGDSWSDWFDETTGLTHPQINDLALHPKDRDILFAATEGGIFHSTDAGESWEPVFAEYSVQVIEYSASNFNVIYASGKTGSLRSTNGGRDWDPVWENTLPASTTLVSLNTDPEFLYSGTTTGLFKSFNAGRNWVSDKEFKKSPVLALFVDPSNLAHIFAGSGDNLYSSLDGGDSWKNLFSFSHELNGDSGTSAEVKITHLTRNTEKSFYAGTTSGLYFSADEGKHWSHIDLSGSANQLSPSEMKMDVVKLVTEIHTGRFFGSYFFMLVDLATIGLIFLTISGILIAYYRAKVKKKKKIIEDTVADQVIDQTEATDEISTESQEIHDMIEHITEHIEKCQLVYMDQEKKEIDEISRHLNTLDKKMHRLMENFGEWKKTSKN